MSEKRDSKPAFPVHPDILGDSIHQDWRGMTMRDYFAAKAMQGELAAMFDGEGGVSGLPLGIEDADLSRLAKHWYRISDAMLAERNK